MAETPESAPVPSSSENVESDIKDEGPLAKKRKMLLEKEHSEKLEHRLGAFCAAQFAWTYLLQPYTRYSKCSNGHLMCAPCFTHLLADARLRDETATCPNCRIEISRTSASRNLAVEKTVSELPSECRFCTRVYPRHSLQNHEDNICEERRYRFAQIVVDGTPERRPMINALLRIVTGVYSLLLTALRRTYLVSEASEAPLKRRRYRRLTGCKYACIGCGWRGPWHEAGAHEQRCSHPARSAADLLALIAERDRHARHAAAVYEQILDLLSYEKITFNDLQLRPYRTEEFVHKLYYETSRFSAFGHQWVMKAFVNRNERDPTQSAQREITYQLILKSKTSSALGVQWVCVRGPWGEARLAARVAQHSFRDDAPDAPPLPLPLAEPRDANRLLATKPLHCRLIMFLSSK